MKRTPAGNQKVEKKNPKETNNDSGNESREENAPWENFEPFSPQKMSWMIQEICNQTTENRKLIDKILQTVDKTKPISSPRDCERCFTRWLNRLGEHPRNDSWEDYLDEDDYDYDEEDEFTEEQGYWLRFRENNLAATLQQHIEEKLRNDAAASNSKDRETFYASCAAAFADPETIEKHKDPKCPFGTMEVLTQVEEKLRSDASYSSRLMNYQLLILPGQDARKLLENILGFLISDKLAMQFTYKGKAPLHSFKELLLCDVIKKTVRRKFPMMEERFFSERIGAWLVYRKREYSAKLQRTA